MSFFLIKDISKRDKLVAEYLKTKNKIQDDFRSERLGEQSLFEDFGKIFKPITEQQQKSSEDIVSKLTPLQEAIEIVPALQALPQPNLKGLQAEARSEALAEPPLTSEIGPLAKKYLVDSYGKAGDKTFRLNTRGRKFFVGNAEIDFEGNDLIIGGKKYTGTRGLWDLITRKTL